MKCSVNIYKVFKRKNYKNCIIDFVVFTNILIYKPETSVLGSWVPDVHAVSAMDAQNCTLNIPVDSELLTNNV